MDLIFQFLIMCLYQITELIHSINLIFGNAKQLGTCLQHCQIQLFGRTPDGKLQYKCHLGFLQIRNLAQSVLIPRLLMGLLQIIHKSFQTIEHPFCIIITDLQVLSAPFAVKFQNTAQTHSRADLVNFSVFRDICPGLSSRSMDPDGDNILIPAV